MTLSLKEGLDAFLKNRKTSIPDLLDKYFESREVYYCMEYKVERDEHNTFFFMMDILGISCHVLHIEDHLVIDEMLTSDSDELKEYLKINQLIK